MSGSGRGAELVEREHRHAQRADAHRIEGQFQRQAGAGGLAGGQRSQLDGVVGDVAGDQHDQQRARRIDQRRAAAAGSRSTKKATPAFSPRASALAAPKKARADHQPARDVVGPFDRRIEAEAQQHRGADDHEIGGQQDGRDRVAEAKQQAQCSRGGRPRAGTARQRRRQTWPSQACVDADDVDDRPWTPAAP